MLNNLVDKYSDKKLSCQLCFDGQTIVLDKKVNSPCLNMIILQSVL